MSTTDSKPPRPTLRKPVKPPRAVVAPAPVVQRPRPSPSPVAAAAPTPVPSTKKPRFRKPRKEPVAEAPVPAVEGERLSKRVMALKDCSRKEAEQYIEGGWVRVNGVVVEEPALRVDRHTVTLDPEASLLNQIPVTLLLNKPPGYADGTEELPPPTRGRKPVPDARSLLNAQTHWEHDPSETPVLQRHFKHLEADIELENGASGLVVFTQDWRTTRKLTEDMGTMEHEFLVEVKGEVAPEALKPMGYALKDERLDLPSVKVSVNSSTPELSRLRFAIKGSHPGLVAYLCGLAKLDILAMRRIRLGRVTIAELPVGQWRFLAGYEKF